jgi:cation-transporting ATPase E
MRAFPAAICVILNIITIAVFMAKDVIPMSDAELSTISVYITALSGMLLIVRLSIPFNALRIVMMTVCTAGFCLGSALFGQFFVLAPLSLNALLMLLVFSVVTVIIFNVVYNLNERMINKYKNRAKLQK